MRFVKKIKHASSFFWKPVVKLLPKRILSLPNRKGKRSFSAGSTILSKNEKSICISVSSESLLEKTLLNKYKMKRPSVIANKKLME